MKSREISIRCLNVNFIWGVGVGVGCIRDPVNSFRDGLSIFNRKWFQNPKNTEKKHTKNNIIALEILNGDLFGMVNSRDPNSKVVST